MNSLRAAVWSFFLLLGACAAAPAAAQANLTGERSAPPPGCDLEPLADCQIGTLPRLSETSWLPGALDTFVARAKEGTVAVDWQADRGRVIADCRLDGSYSEIAGEAGSGRFWATGRVLFRLDEVAGPCLTATHVVASYVLGSGAAPGAGKVARFAAVLVPLPCPSVLDSKPARGCIGRGLTGPDRRGRAQQVLAGLRGDRVQKADPAQLIVAHMLAPDDAHGLHVVKNIASECALREHVRWSVKQYQVAWDGRDRKATASLAPKDFIPRLDMGGSAESCLMRPVFLECFPGAFDPAPSGVACWHTFDRGIAPGPIPGAIR